MLLNKEYTGSVYRYEPKNGFGYLETKIDNVDYFYIFVAGKNLTNKSFNQIKLGSKVKFVLERETMVKDVVPI